MKLKGLVKCTSFLLWFAASECSKSEHCQLLDVWCTEASTKIVLVALTAAVHRIYKVVVRDK